MLFKNMIKGMKMTTQIECRPVHRSDLPMIIELVSPTI